jgi:hypothetical protein
LRAPGLLLGFPLTPSGGVAGGANDEYADEPAPVPLTLAQVNQRFKRESSLSGAAPAAPRDATKLTPRPRDKARCCV